MFRRVQILTNTIKPVFTSKKGEGKPAWSKKILV